MHCETVIGTQSHLLFCQEFDVQSICMSNVALVEIDHEIPLVKHLDILLMYIISGL